MKTTLIPALAVALLTMGASNAGANVTITGSQLSGCTYIVSGAGATSQYVSTGGGYAYITSPDNVGGGSFAQIEDFASVVVPNGYEGVSLGTLNSLLAQGIANNVIFYNANQGGNNGHFAYWYVLLSNPTNPSDTLQINADSNEMAGTNPFNQGMVSNSSIYATATLPGGTSIFPFKSLWSSVVTVVYDGVALGNWNVTGVGVAVGGEGSGITSTAQISSFTLPGVAAPAPVSADTPTMPQWALIVLGAILCALALQTRTHVRCTASD